jgi:hypothetical protein
MTIIWSGNRKKDIHLFARRFAYLLILKMNRIVSPARLLQIVPARFRCSFEERDRERRQNAKTGEANIVVRLWIEMSINYY